GNQPVLTSASPTDVTQTSDVRRMGLELAELLLTQLLGIDPSAVRDEYSEALNRLVAAVTAGRELEAPAGPREPPQDLMAALEASIRASRRDGGAP
ncbi:hypothetical protein RMT89_12120, partial [Streptomyces sp. P17]|nr:hypothetical protein [Streptomyces sp. P17]